MKNASTAFWAVLLIGSLGMWGCSQQKNGANVNRIRELEARYIKIEEDYRSLVVTGESHRRRLSQVEAQRGELTLQLEELKNVVVERDQLRQQLQARVIERDQAQSQLSQFAKDLQSLANRAELAAAGQNPNVLQAIPTSRPVMNTTDE